MSPVYRQFDQVELDREYSPSSCVADLGAELAAYTEGSAAAYAALPGHRELRYGTQAPEVLDFFPAAGPAAPLHVFVHGGYWQELDKADSVFAAPDFTARGTAFAAIGYGLAPKWPLDAIVAQVRRAVRRLLTDAEQLGVDPQRVYLSGSSAGAHLAAMALLDPEPAPDGRRVAGAVLLSGVYDLEPISLSYVNEALGLDAAAARRNSPLHLPQAGLPPLLIAVGEHETAEFGRQHEEFTASVRAAGVPVHAFTAAGRNHFDLPLDLGRADSRLGREVLERFGS
ncbi:alpha/beta hydrolase [Kitasatospora sp. NPDC048540]|uniref:alpha/beta hydrolase n=1 Tax=unclassified Kitasatospora TaxID=2633591 RepID=UPI00053B232D|nr:alpha/beta hydrolase [Kitasatospora sp. MBT63]